MVKFKQNQSYHAHSTTVRTPGVIFHRDLSLSHIPYETHLTYCHIHLHSTAKLSTAYSLLERYRKITPCICSWLNYCNSILLGCAKKSMKSPQLANTCSFRSARDYISSIFAPYYPIRSLHSKDAGLQVCKSRMGVKGIVLYSFILS